MMTEFLHLYPAARQLAALSSEERIHRIRADRWISYPRAEVALVKLETLMSFPERARMPNLLIVGESGMGKTMIIEKFTRDHPASFDETTGRLHMPVVAVQMVSGPDESRFYRRILAAIGAPEPPRATARSPRKPGVGTSLINSGMPSLTNTATESHEPPPVLKGSA